MAAGAEAAAGPVASVPDTGLRRFWNISRALAVTDFKLRYFGSVLGYLWALARPLMLFGVLYVVFTKVVRFGGDVNFYPVLLLSGMVLNNFFAEASGDSVTSIVTQQALLQKISFPAAAIPFSRVLNAAINFSLNLVVVIGFMLASGVSVRLSWLLLPVILVMMFIYGVGVSLVLSALYVRYRDMEPIWDVALQILFYASPILYPIELVPTQLAHFLMCNPMAVVIEQVRHWMIDPTAPTAAQAIGGGARLLIPTAILFGALALGIRLYRKRAPYFAEEL